jgi:purine-nucleoside phosphorylase
VDAAVAAARRRAAATPRVALILGSGLGAYAEGFTEAWEIPYTQVPGIPAASVQGHGGKFVGGMRSGVSVVAQAGRLHPYEGHSPSIVGFPLRVMHGLGARILIVTNAAGGVGAAMDPGVLMLIADHVNFQFAGPLRGRGPLVDGDRLVDLSEPYSRRLLALAAEAARAARIPGVRTGVYWGNQGPAYETPAEVRMIRSLGGDAVGMSTVPEVVTARHLGMDVLGVACIANRAAGLSAVPLSHADVIAQVSENRERLTVLLDAVLDAVHAAMGGNP